MGNVPFLLAPCGKDYLWGGSRLNEEFQKNIDMFPLAETWECSTHPDGPSIVACGPFKGKALDEVLRDNPGFLGRKADKEGRLPVLLKLIDADSDLSVQVHPSDEYAFVKEEGQLGKTEMWYVLDAAEGAELVYGLSHDLTAEDVKEAIEEKSLRKYLNRVKVKKGDIFFIEPGTIHAIGAGIVLAEVQENSNLTYRLFDYDRIDKNGALRELNIEKALEVARLSKSLEPKQPLRVVKYSQGSASEVLCRCKYFEVHRLIVNSDENKPYEWDNDQDSYTILLCIDGSGKISFAEDEEANIRENGMSIKKGDCIFVPANSVKMKLSGKCEYLKVRG